MKLKDIKMLDVNRVMRERLMFRKKITDEYIQDLDAYEDYVKVRGEVNHRKSRIVNQAMAENTKEFLVFRVRYRTDLDETMIIEYKTKPYHIESIIPLSNENLYMEITCYRYKNDMFGG